MFYRLLSFALEALVILIAFFIVVLVSTEVVLRYGFGSTLFITQELTRNLMVILVFLGAAIGFRDKSHIRMNFMVQKLPPGLRRWVKLFAHLLSVFFLVILLITGTQVLPDRLDQVLNTINIPIFYFYLAIPFGSLLMIIYLVPQIKETLRADASAKEPNSHNNKDETLS